MLQWVPAPERRLCFYLHGQGAPFYSASLREPVTCSLKAVLCFFPQPWSSQCLFVPCASCWLFHKLTFTDLNTRLFGLLHLGSCPPPRWTVYYTWARKWCVPCKQPVPYETASCDKAVKVMTLPGNALGSEKLETSSLNGQICILFSSPSVCIYFYNTSTVEIWNLTKQPDSKANAMFLLLDILKILCSSLAQDI